MEHYAYNSPFVLEKNGEKYDLKIVQEEGHDSPRDEWNNVCKMICFSRKYRIGDAHCYTNMTEALTSILFNLLPTVTVTGDDFYGINKLKRLDREQLYDAIEVRGCGTTIKLLEMLADDIIIKPLWLYDHSGLSISTGRPLGYSQDSFYIGFVYVTKEMYKEKVSFLLDDWREKAEKCLYDEIEDYNKHLRCEWYGYILTKKTQNEVRCPHCNELISVETNDEDIDSRWGFLGVSLTDNGIEDVLSDYTFIED